MQRSRAFSVASGIQDEQQLVADITMNIVGRFQLHVMTVEGVQLSVLW